MVEHHLNKLHWKTEQLLEKNSLNELTKPSQKEEAKTYLFGGNAFLTKDNKTVFVVHIKDNENKNKIAVIYSEGADGKMKFETSNVENVDGCTLSFFPWGNKKIIMIPTNCTEEGKKNNTKVKESSDLGKKWSESAGPFAPLLGFMQDKNNFTTATINNVLLLLFTQRKPKATTADRDQKNFDAHVWFSDGNRVYNAGPIVTAHNIISSHLLHTNNELFALHQNISGNTIDNIKLTRLEDQLKNIKSVVTAWKTSDDTVRKLFKRIISSSPTSNATDGLVGFLSWNSEGNSSSWKDEYFFMNATMNGGTKADGGLKFEGKGAKWPVGEKKEDQPYNFTDPGFTLVANVTIDGDASDKSKDNSVLSVVYNKEGNEQTKNAVGLWCSKDGKWVVNGKEEKRGIVTNGRQCQQGNTYLVAVMSSNGKCSLYVDGEQVSNNEKDCIITESFKSTFYFYFGVDINDQKATNNEDESHVTVRNALLYNRPFTNDEIKKLKIPKETKIPEQTSDSIDDNQTKNSSNTHGSSEISKDRGGDAVSASQSSRTGEGEEKSTSQPESSTVRGGYVGVFVCFVMLAHALCFL